TNYQDRPRPRLQPLWRKPFVEPFSEVRHLAVLAGGEPVAEHPGVIGRPRIAHAHEGEAQLLRQHSGTLGGGAGIVMDRRRCGHKHKSTPRLACPAKPTTIPPLTGSAHAPRKPGKLRKPRKPGSRTLSPQDAGGFDALR